MDKAGRRDKMHMLMTTTSSFVSYVAANHPTDYDRLNAWIERIRIWKEQGLEELDFFIQQNLEKESSLLASHFIKSLNKELGISLKIPNSDNNP